MVVHPITFILKILRDGTGNGTGLTVDDILLQLEAYRNGRVWPYWPEYYLYEAYDLEHPRYLTLMLEDMQEEGFVQGTGEGESKRWRLEGTYDMERRPPEPPRDDDGGDNGGAGGGDGDDEDGGAGFREILSHPTLFVIPEDEFDDYLSRALGVAE